jgi:hypothetical protein
MMEMSETRSQPESNPPAAKQTRESEGSMYVVQQATVDTNDQWEDIAVVSVPKRSYRSTVLTTALAEARVTPTEIDRFRVLDAVAAEELAVTPKEPAAPEFEVTVV